MLSYLKVFGIVRGSSVAKSIWRARMSRILLLTVIVTTSVPAAYAGPPEQISIETLLAQAPSYDLHVVTLHGVTSELQIFPPFPVPKCGLVQGRATFTLDDGTGSIKVEALGTCSRQAVDTLPKDGSLVRMTATIHLLDTNLPFRVQAVADTIQVLESR